MTETTFFEHPFYALNRDAWQRYDDLYQGDHEILTRPCYLWMHEFESDTIKGGLPIGPTEVNDRGNIIAAGSKLYQIRKLRTRYINYIRPIINRYISLAFKEEINTDDVADIFGEDELENVDGLGTSLVNFIIDEIARNYFLFGKVGVLIDSYDVEVKSQADQVQLGLRPFMQLLKPLEIHDWQYANDNSARRGRLNWLRTEYMQIEDRESASQEPEQRRYSKLYLLDGNTYKVQTYRGDVINASLIAITKSKWEQIDETVIGAGFGDIPVALIDNQSWIRDVSEVALLQHNAQSSLDNILLNQAYQKIIGSGDWHEGDAVVATEATMMLVPKDFTVTVVPPCQPTSLENRLNSITATMFQLAFSRTRLLPADAAGVESGDTQRESKEEFLATLVRGIEQIEALTNRAIEYYAMFKGKTYSKGIQISKDITIEDIDQQLSVEQAYWDRIAQYPTWKKAVLKKRAAEMNLNNTEDILEEIENTEPQEPGEQNPQERTNLFNAAINV